MELMLFLLVLYGRYDKTEDFTLKGTMTSDIDFKFPGVSVPLEQVQEDLDKDGDEDNDGDTGEDSEGDDD
jgi:hypothetical protein